jgi:hypothetical protein
MKLHADAERRAAKVPPMRRPLYLRAVRGQASPRSAIKAMCCECMGWEEVAEAVRGCTSPACPLYAYRPFQAVGDE